MDQEIEVHIEFNEFITRLELNYILESIDREIERVILPDVLRSPSRHSRPITTHIGISGVAQGSIILRLVFGKKVGQYVEKRFRRGLKKSALGPELERSGKIAGNLLAEILKRLNDWADGYSKNSLRKRGNIQRVTIHGKSRFGKDDR